MVNWDSAWVETKYDECEQLYRLCKICDVTDGVMTDDEITGNG